MHKQPLQPGAWPQLRPLLLMQAGRATFATKGNMTVMTLHSVVPQTVRAAAFLQLPGVKPRVITSNKLSCCC